MHAWVSQTLRRSIMTFFPKIVLLIILDPKIPKAVKNFVQTAFGVCLTVYNRRYIGLFWKKVTRMGALGPTDPWYYFSFTFHSFIANQKILGREMQISSIKFDWLHRLESRTSRFHGKPLTAKPPQLYQEFTHWSHRPGWLFFINFLFSVAANFTHFFGYTWSKINFNQQQNVSIWYYNTNVFFFKE